MTVVIENRNALPTGYQLEEYRILSVIGQGDIGITYLAQDTKKNYQIALKEYFPKDLAIRENSNSIIQPQYQQNEKDFIWGLERFFKEGQVLTNFQHPNIVRVLRSFKVHNTAYIVMEYEQGQSLSNILSEKETISETEIINFLPPLLSGLHAIHEAGFLHQNITPASIYLRDKNHTPVLLDFGAARYAIGRLHRNIEPIITAGYAPFEQYQIKGPQGPWTDIYALGAVLYRAISGQTPVEVLRRIDAITRQKEDDPLPLAIQIGHHHYSENLLQGIDWALQIAEEDRPQTVQQWANTLLPKSSKPLKFYHSAVSLERPQKRRFNRWVFAGIVAIIGLNVGYVFYTKQRMAHLQQHIAHLQQQKTLEIQKLQKQTVTKKAILQQISEETQRKLDHAHQTIEIKQNNLAQLQSENVHLQKNLETVQWQLRNALIAIDKAKIKKLGEIIRDLLPDHSEGPDMVWVPGGRFRMGDIQGKGNDNERPVHWANVGSFAIGRYEVTFAEYDRFAEATGRKKPDDNDWGRNYRPVINVSWFDAIAYAEWLSQQTGHRYRLPTEVEWEYAARAGTITQYWWGDGMKPNFTHCKGCDNQESDQKTALVGSFVANPFGIYDMDGNVREWTCSEYEGRYYGKEQFCINNPNSTHYRVERGGSMLHQPKYVRVSARYGSNPYSRYPNVGFRLVREN